MDSSTLKELQHAFHVVGPLNNALGLSSQMSFPKLYLFNTGTHGFKAIIADICMCLNQIPQEDNTCR